MGMYIELSNCGLYDFFNDCNSHYSLSACEFFNEEFDGREADPIMGFAEYGDNDSSLDFDDFVNDYEHYLSFTEYLINYVGIDFDEDSDEEDYEDEYMEDYIEQLIDEVARHDYLIKLSNGNVLVAD